MVLPTPTDPDIYFVRHPDTHYALTRNESVLNAINGWLQEQRYASKLTTSGGIMVYYRGIDTNIMTLTNGALEIECSKDAHGGGSVYFYLDTADPDMFAKLAGVIDRGPWV